MDHINVKGLGKQVTGLSARQLELELWWSSLSPSERATKRSRQSTIAAFKFMGAWFGLATLVGLMKGEHAMLDHPFWLLLFWVVISASWGVAQHEAALKEETANSIWHAQRLGDLMQLRDATRRSTSNLPTATRSGISSEVLNWDDAFSQSFPDKKTPNSPR